MVSDGCVSAAQERDTSNFLGSYVCLGLHKVC